MNGIAISGKQLSGKTTTKRFLKAALEARGIPVAELSFAGPLKETVAHMTGLTVDEVNATKAGAYGDRAALFARALLQHVGVRERLDDPDYWVRKLADHLQPGTFYIVDDCRFPNEARAMKAAGFLLVRLDVSPGVQAARGVVKNPMHESETALDDYDGFDVRLNVDDVSPAVVARIVLHEAI